MDQRLNVITLGVEDVPRAKAFYERLGWKVAFTDGDIVMFQAGPMIVSLWSRAKLADDTGVALPPAGWGGFTLGYAVRAAAEVDALCAQAAEAGATVTRAPVKKVFGYSGAFADPDGHTWEIAWIESLAVHADGTVELPS
jgi:predicted lactoylglutathione lyase